VAATALMVVPVVPVAQPDTAAASKAEWAWVATVATLVLRATEAMAARVEVPAATAVTRALLVQADSQGSRPRAISAPGSLVMVSPGDPRTFKVSSCTPWLSAQATSACRVGQ
jgi:hypothetical protein